MKGLANVVQNRKDRATVNRRDKL